MYKGTEDNAGKCCQAGARTTVGVSATHIYDLKEDYAIYNQDPYFEVLEKWMQTSTVSYTHLTLPTIYSV